MPRERPAYRDNLQSILEFTGGAHVLTTKDVLRYTGIKDQRTAKRHFPFAGNIISAESLARCLAGGEIANG